VLPLVEEWLQEAAKCGLQKPIAAGGGIQKKQDVHRVLQSGLGLVEAVCIGSVTIVRPWRTLGIINEAKKAVAAQPRREKCEAANV
jgi:phosphoribosylformimino-5-aminoimidazole carboxamide ribonucleotide (ProFAR) isomerase